MAADIGKCQALGKKVLLGMGGANELANTTIPNKLKAKSLATQLWDLFGASTSIDPAFRPFSFDIDNEDNNSKNYNTFVSLLRQIMSTDTSKKYYISAAPQCPIPDKSIPLESMQAMDFVFVQWYNNPVCNAGTSPFLESFKAWSKHLSKNSGRPKVFIGLPGCQSCAGSVYLNASQLPSTLEDAKGANVTNFGGVMLWDGPQAVANLEGGKDYLTQLKEILRGT